MANPWFDLWRKIISPQGVSPQGTPEQEQPPLPDWLRTRLAQGGTAPISLTPPASIRPMTAFEKYAKFPVAAEVERYKAHPEEAAMEALTMAIPIGSARTAFQFGGRLAAPAIKEGLVPLVEQAIKQAARSRAAAEALPAVLKAAQEASPLAKQVAGRAIQVAAAPFYGLEKGLGAISGKIGAAVEATKAVLPKKAPAVPAGKVAPEAAKIAESVKPTPFVHYGRVEGVTELKPEFHGTGINGTEKRTAQEYKDIFQKRIYAYHPEHTPDAKLSPNYYVGQVEKVLLAPSPEYASLEKQAAKAVSKKYGDDSRAIEEMTIKLAAKDYDAIDYGVRGMKILKPAKVTEISRDLIRGIIASTKETGGATFSLTKGNLARQPLFAVSEKFESFPKVTTVKESRILGEISENIDLLKQPDMAVGTWVDKEGKALEISVSKTFATQEEALQYARSKGERFIYDLKAGAEIPTGVVPGEVPPVRPPVPPTAVGATPDEPTDNFIAFLKGLKPISREQKEARRQVLQQRAGAVAGQLEAGKGEEAFKAAKGQLRGELPKIRAESANPLTADDRNMLFEIIRTTDKLPPIYDEVTRRTKAFTRLNVSDALEKVLKGDTPTAHEIQILEEVFGSKVGKALLDRLSWGDKAKRIALDLWDMPKMWKAAYDVSFIWRQGAPLTVGNPQAAREALATIRAYAKPEVEQEVLKRIASSPHKMITQLLEDSGQVTIRFTHPSAVMANREEFFTSRGLEDIVQMLGGEKLTFAGKPMTEIARILQIPLDRSNITYSTYLNALRSGVWEHTLASWERLGMQFAKLDPITGTYKAGKDLPFASQLAQLINLGSGRGTYPTAQGLTTILNRVFFAPQLAASRFVYPVKLIQGMFSRSKAMRAFAWRNMVTYVGTNTALLKLLVAGGLGTVEWNPQSSDFGQLRIGNIRYDPWSGFRPAVVLMARLATGAMKTTTTGRERPIDYWGTVSRFIGGKSHPAISALKAAITGKSFVGEDIPAGWKRVFRYVSDNMQPLITTDIVEALQAEGVLQGIGAGVASAVGMGVTAFDSSSQGARDVNFSMSQYQELVTQANKLLEENKAEELKKLLAKYPSAGFFNDNGKIASKTARSLGSVSRQLKEMQDVMEKIDKAEASEKTKLEAKKLLAQKMQDLALSTLENLDKVEAAGAFKSKSITPSYQSRP